MAILLFILIFLSFAIEPGIIPRNHQNYQNGKDSVDNIQIKPKPNSSVSTNNEEKIELNTENYSKGMVLHITDKKLLSLTNGIVQGMSGSPIIQDGKIIGAVTHVFVQDSTRGYGIFVENMIKFSDNQ